MKWLRALALLATTLATLAAVPVPALADFLFTSGSGNTGFDFVCFSTKHCFATVIINSAGTEYNSSTPFQVTGANGTFPITGSVSITGTPTFTLSGTGAVNVSQMGGTSIAAGCTASLSTLVTTTVPATICGSFGTYVLNALAAGAAVVASSSPVTPSNLAVGAATFNTGAQISVGTSATLISAARTGVAGTGRVSLTICNTGTTAVYLGGVGITGTNGQLLAGVIGACATFNTTAAIYGIVGSGTQSVAWSETY